MTFSLSGFGKFAVEIADDVDPELDVATAEAKLGAEVLEKEKAAEADLLDDLEALVKKHADKFDGMTFYGPASKTIDLLAKVKADAAKDVASVVAPVVDEAKKVEADLDLLANARDAKADAGTDAGIAAAKAAAASPGPSSAPEPDPEAPAAPAVAETPEAPITAGPSDVAVDPTVTAPAVTSGTATTTETESPAAATPATDSPASA
jgi:hypothetical protein